MSSCDLAELSRLLQKIGVSQDKATYVIQNVLSSSSCSPSDSASTQSRPFIETVVNELTQKGLIAPPDEWASQDCATAAKVLGINYFPDLYGRDDALQGVVAEVEFGMPLANYGRKPFNLISGVSGTGKSRLMYDAAKWVSRDGSTAILACTFSNAHNASLNRTLELGMLTISEQLPVVLRLMHSYMGVADISWGEFAQSSMSIIHNLRTLYGMVKRVTINDVLTIISGRHEKPRLLLLMDETLRWLDFAASEEEAPEQPELRLEVLNMKVESMISSVCLACDGCGKAVIFSAMSSTLLSCIEIESARPTHQTTLTPLTSTHSQRLTAAVVKGSLDQLQQLTGLSAEEVVATLDALAVGGLPCAAEILHEELTRSFAWQCGFGSIFALVSCVLTSLANKYSLPWELAALAVTSEGSWPLDKQLPGCPQTAREAVLRGWLPQPRKGAKSTLVYLPPALLLSTLLKGPSADSQGCRAQGLQQAAYYLACLTSILPRDLWEEIVLRTFILRSHLPPHCCRLDGMSPTAEERLSAGCAHAMAPTALVPSPHATEYFCPSFLTVHLDSLLKLFRGITRDRFRGSMIHTDVCMAWPLDYTVLRYPSAKPPTPAQLDARPELMQHLFASESLCEAGIGALLFVRKVSDKPNWIAVGLQCKWSCLDVNSTDTVPCIITAHTHFHTTMMDQGWCVEQLILIFLAHPAVVRSSIDGTALPQAINDNVAAIGLGSGLEEWLGPSILHLARNMHLARVPHGPFAAFI